MMRVFFLIRSLNVGGAERQLIELVRGMDKTCFAITVASFYDGGELRPDLEKIAGVKVVSLHKKGRWDILPFLWRLKRVVRAAQPQIVHGYGGVANELTLMMGKIDGAKVVWGLRASNMDFSYYGWLSIWLFHIGAWFSRFADLIIANSYAGAQHHIAQGYCRARMMVIPNGIDTERFRPDCKARQQMRYEWRVAKNERVIGIVGRLDPMKDYPSFLRAAALLTQKRHDVRFVCVGGGPAPYVRELRSLAEKLDLGERLIWAGVRNDMAAVYNAFDIATSASSYGEGFSNVIGEAMACGVPCVVTDVGDSAIIVGNTGQIVPPHCPEALTAAWTRLLDLPCEQRAALSKAARERIMSEYTVRQLVKMEEATLRGLLQ
jgi:glycosyltransferase involved in cell wall biosynthesis